MSMHRVASVPQQGRRTTRLDDVLTAGLSRGFRSGVTISAPEENNNTNNTKQQADKLHQLEEKLKECHERVAQYLEAASKDAANSNEKAAMAEAEAKRNVIPQLVAAVRDGTDTQKEDAAGELWTLAVGNPFNRAAIKSARGIPPLVELVRRRTRRRIARRRTRTRQRRPPRRARRPSRPRAASHRSWNWCVMARRCRRSTPRLR